MGTVVKVPFEVTGWEPEPEPLDLGDAGPVAFGRVRMRKTFSGVLTGTLHGRTGSFVLQHTGVVDDGAPPPSGVVLPGTGTGELAGLHGTMTIAHDESGAVLTLDYELP